MTNGEDVPATWMRVAIDDVVELGPRWFSEEPNAMDDVSVVPMAAIEEETGRLDGSQCRAWRTVRTGFTRFQDGDVVFAKITPCMENGKIALARGLHRGRAAGTTELHVLRPSPALDGKFLLYFLLQASTRAEARHAMRGAAGQLRVPASYLESLPIPIPPVGEQNRIVAAIDEHLTKLDAAIASLERARANVKRYRAAVYHSAARGALATYESAATIPDSLLLLAQERAAIAAAADSTQSLPTPTHWPIFSLDALTDRITSGSRDWSPYYGRGTGTFVLAQNVKPGRLDLSFRQAVDPPPDSNRERSRIRRGDLLITIVGANTGDVCAVDQDVSDYFVSQSVALVRPFDTRLTPYLSAYLNSEEDGGRILLRYAYGAGRPHLNFDQLKMVPVPLPPLAEQEALVADLERRVSHADQVNAQIHAAITRASRFRQSILKLAFEGKLVPQNPNDEPAAAMLARLRSARSQNGAAPQANKRSKKQRVR